MCILPEPSSVAVPDVVQFVKKYTMLGLILFFVLFTRLWRWSLETSVVKPLQLQTHFKDCTASRTSAMYPLHTSCKHHAR